MQSVGWKHTRTRGTPGLPMKLPNLAMDSGVALLQVMAWTRILMSTSRDSHRGRKVARKAAICRTEAVTSGVRACHFPAALSAQPVHSEFLLC